MNVQDLLPSVQHFLHEVLQAPSDEPCCTRNSMGLSNPEGLTPELISAVYQGAQMTNFPLTLAVYGLQLKIVATSVE